MKKIAIVTVLGIIIGLGLSFYGIPVVGDSLGYYYNEEKSVLLSGVSTATNTPSHFDVKGRQNITITVLGNYASGTVKFTGTNSATQHDPISALSVNNYFTYLNLTDVSSNTAYAGSTGLALSASTTVTSQTLRLTSPNINLSYLTPIITDYATGTIKVIITSDEGNN